MRIRAMIAALAVACSLALCAVPAFADDLDPDNEVEVSYPEWTWSSTSTDVLPLVGVFRDADGLVLTVTGVLPSNSNPYWKISSNGSSYTDTEVPTTVPYHVDDDDPVAYVRMRYSWVDSEGHTQSANITFHIIGMGTENDINGVFGMTTYAIGNVLNWVSTWINAIVSNSVLMFFCIAICLLTIGITILKRVLSVRA